MATDKKKIKVIVIHGPNLNMLGKREPDIYGHETLDTIDRELKRIGKTMGIIVDTFQSNHEGEIVDRLQQATDHASGIIINPAAYTHTSVAIRDALLALNLPLCPSLCRGSRGGRTPRAVVCTCLPAFLSPARMRSVRGRTVLQKGSTDV